MKISSFQRYYLTVVQLGACIVSDIPTCANSLSLSLAGYLSYSVFTIFLVSHNSLEPLQTALLMLAL